MCKICNTINADAYSTIHCCVLEESSSLKLTVGDIVVIHKRPFIQTSVNDQWCFQRVLDPESKTKLVYYPYWVICSIYDGRRWTKPRAVQRDDDVIIKYRRYYLTSKMFGYTRELSVNGSSELIRIEPRTVPDEVLAFSMNQK